MTELLIPDHFIRCMSAYDVFRSELHTRYDVRYGNTQITIGFKAEPSSELKEIARKKMQKSLRIRLNRWGMKPSRFLRLPE